MSVLTVLKMVVQVQKARWVLWFHRLRSAVGVQRRLRTVTGRKQPMSCRFTSSVNCFMRLAAYVKEKAPGNNDSEMQLEWLLVWVSTNQETRVPSDKHATHNSAQYSATFHTEKLKSPNFAICNCLRQTSSPYILLWLPFKISRQNFYSQNCLQLWSHLPFVGKVARLNQGVSSSNNPHELPKVRERVQSYGICQATHRGLFELLQNVVHISLVI